MKYLKYFALLFIILLCSAQAYATQENRKAPSTLATGISSSEVSDTLTSREITLDSAFSLPKRGNRISLFSYERGLGSGFELGTAFLYDVVGFSNIEVGYNFLNVDNLAFKASTWTGYNIVAEPSEKKSWFVPQFTVSLLEAQNLHTHASVFYSDVSHIGIGYSSFAGWVHKIYPEQYLGFNINTEMRRFSEDRYIGSFILGVQKTLHLDDHKDTLGSSASYLWAWNKLHTSLGINYSSQKMVLFNHFSPSINLYWTF